MPDNSIILGIANWGLVHLERLQVRLNRAKYGSPLSWATRNPLPDAPKEPLVNFMIPLISRRRARDWSVVQKNLRATLGSLLAQSNPNWTATVACQDTVDALPADRRIRNLSFSIPSKYFAANDKRPKLRSLIRDASKTMARDGYIFFLDGDDIVHPNLVDFICRDNNGHGYYVDKGYLVDFSQSKAVPLGFDKNESRGFHLVNGSVTALRFRPDHRRTFEYPALNRGDHQRSHIKMLDFGLILSPVPFPAVCYTFTHGDNLHSQRGLDAVQQKLLADAAIGDTVFQQVKEDFRLEHLDSHTQHQARRLSAL